MLRDFNTFNTRSIIKNVYRLIPGEIVNFDRNLSIRNKIVDKSSLFQVNNSDIDTSADYIRNTIQKDINYLLLDTKEVHLGLSGGLDSRIVMAFLPEDVNVNSHTYGSSNYYETIIAKKTAKIRGSKFTSYPIYDLFFPPLEVFKKYTKKTDSVYVSNWLSILENTQKQTDEYFILGDVYDLITAKGLKTYSTRDAKIKAFYKTITNSEYIFTESNDITLNNWSEKLIKNHLDKVDKYANALHPDFNLKLIKQDYESDLTNFTNYIKSINPTYVELYDEIYNWHYHGRTSMFKQVNVMNSKFMGVLGFVTTNYLRNITCIHPNHRLRFRLFDKIMKGIPNNKYLSLPTAQIPYTPYNYPAPIKELVWAFRSKFDSYLTNRIKKSKNANLKYRLMPSTNYVKLYKNINYNKNVYDWYNKKWINSDFFLDILKRRISLDTQPLQNFDLIGPAHLSISLDLMFE
jgi:hypothetical protein